MSANNENDEKSEPIAGFQDINAFTQVGWKYTKQDYVVKSNIRSRH